MDRGFHSPLLSRAGGLGLVASPSSQGSFAFSIEKVVTKLTLLDSASIPGIRHLASPQCDNGHELRFHWQR